MVEIEATIEYEKCFVAFLDILGFRLKVIGSRDSADKLKILIDSLKICGGFSSGGKKATNDSGQQRIISVRHRSFSDTIVFFMKKNQDDIAQLFLMIRYLQDRLWEKGICLRGAITIGDMYWPDKKNNITAGPGLIEAYKLESEIAIYPRIVVSQKLLEYIDSEEIRAYPFGQPGNLKDFIQRDEDGIYFLDLLNENIVRAQDETLDKNNNSFSIIWTDESNSKCNEITAKVIEMIDENKNDKDNKILQKYEWLNSYLESKVR